MDRQSLDRAHASLLEAMEGVRQEAHLTPEAREFFERCVEATCIEKAQIDEGDATLRSALPRLEALEGTAEVDEIAAARLALTAAMKIRVELVKRWAQGRSQLMGLSRKLAPKHTAKVQQEFTDCLNALGRMSDMRHANTAGPRSAPHRVAARTRQSRRQISTTRSRIAVAAAAGESSGSQPSRGALGSRPPAPSADDEPHPPGRIRHRHEWILAGVSTAPAGSPASFKAVAS